MPYDNDPRVIEWFERALRDDRPRVRRRAVELLEEVETDRRDAWLRLAERDSDPRVAAAGALVSAILSVRAQEAPLELLESDIFEGLDSPDLEWEWEYAVKVCRGLYVPASAALAWTREEDDEAAKLMALMKTFPGGKAEEEAVPIIVDKRAVTRYTRSPRSMVEAIAWHNNGRPRYEEP